MQTLSYSSQNIDKSDILRVNEVLRSAWITQGPKVKEFEAALCDYTGARYAVCVSNGTAALHIACLAAEIKHGDSAITSPTTFVASANCIVYCGGKPIFADIQKDTLNIDPKEIINKVTKKTKVIIPVHFAGHPCDLKEISEIAKKHNIAVIEDAAHALGSEYKGEKIGSCKYSDMTTFSFHPVKNITTGEGGAVLTNRKELYDKLVMLRNHGITKDKKMMTKYDGRWYYEQHILGFNYRITDFQCALGISQLRKLDNFIKRRREIFDIYNSELSQIDEIMLPQERPYVRSAWHIYCIRIKDHKKRRSIFNRLGELRIGVQVHYIPVHLQPYYRKCFNYKVGDFINAENYYKEAISIPFHTKMKKNDINYVVRSLKKYFYSTTHAVTI